MFFILAPCFAGIAIIFIGAAFSMWEMPGNLVANVLVFAFIGALLFIHNHLKVRNRDVPKIFKYKGFDVVAYMSERDTDRLLSHIPYKKLKNTSKDEVICVSYGREYPASFGQYEKAIIDKRR